MDEGIRQVINQFPGREAHIRQLWSADEDFRDLCHDYALCLDILVRWSADAMPNGRKAEYLSLRQRLEFEIEMRIRNVQSQRD
jgi:hypothetical protein